ncbi:type II secretion system protein [Cellulomonas sp. NPDC057328]|uniref:type II secretion system protein n=1 Tax=Cellulomonas sp. NPDC057328 TaxID=3346101 RepID=UPI003629C09B
MRTWWHHMQRARAGDAGISLAEVLVAMFLFALVSSGLAYSLLSVLHLSRDARVRAIAANLAAEEIDLARDAPNIFGLLDDERDVTVGSDTFQVVRRTQWVSDPDTEFTCGSAGVGSALRYKRINVTVTWGGMRPGADPVRSDTVLNPDEHINDPTKGTILVSVLRADGTGNEGVTVTASPSVGSVISQTDAQGCTYVLRVNPGTYTIAVSRTGHVSDAQVQVPTQTAVVTANATASLGFQLDQGATYTTHLAPHATGTVRTPTDGSLKMTFLSTYGRATPGATSTADPRRPQYRLHPFTAGYQAVAGTCAAADPTAWPVSDVGGVSHEGVLAPAVAAPPGGSATIEVPMGVVEVSSTGNSNRYLRAESVNPPVGSGLPGCDATETLTYGQVIPTTNGQKVAIALPYGTWRLFYANSSGATGSTLPESRVTIPSPNVAGSVTKAPVGASAVTVTVDPRQPVTP